MFQNDINEKITDNGLVTQILKEREFLANVPFIIYNPSYNEETDILKAQTIDLVRGSTSTTRTVASLFGLSQEYYFGVDALSTQKTFTYNPRNLDIFADGIIISGTSEGYVILDPFYESFYTKQKRDAILEAFRQQKDFNDKLLKYKIFPPLT
jgi:hypothetical protein